MGSNCQTTDLPEPSLAPVERAGAALQGPLASVVDVSQITAQVVTGALTSWVTGHESDVEHVAAASSDGDLLVFYASPRSDGWKVVNASGEAGQKVGGPLTSWVTRDGEYTVEHVAGRAPDGDLLVFVLVSSTWAVAGGQCHHRGRTENR